MQFCNYSVLFTPEDIILKAYIILLSCIPSALILGLLAEEKHIAKKSTLQRLSEVYHPV